MATIKQINANKKNAKKSTGPKTNLGKIKSSQNAIKHGLNAEKFVVIGENINDLNVIKTRLTDELKSAIREQEAETRLIVQNAEERFENKRDRLQNDYDEKANRLQESNTSRMDDLEAKVERDLKDLDDRLSKKLQRALDNPLAN